MSVDAGNQQQDHAWNGTEGEFWVEEEQRFDRAVRPLTAALLAASGVRPADRVLDVGCGCGETSRLIGRIAAAGAVLGIDLSEPMLERARRRVDEEGLANVRFVRGDAQVHPFADASFDLVVSRTGAMFFADRDVAFANLARATAPGGRLVLIAWQALARNEWLQLIRGSLAAGRTLPEPPPRAPTPFALADPGYVGPLLEGAGFTDVSFDGLATQLWFGADVDDAYRFLHRQATVIGMLDGVDEPALTGALARLRSELADHLTADGVTLGSSSWVITAMMDR